MKNKRISVFNKNQIISIIACSIFILIEFLVYYTQLVNDEFCGLKSKLLFFSLSIITLIVIIFIIALSYKRKIEKPECIFLISALLIGILYMFATPLFKGHDEQYHWYKSYTTSIGDFKVTTNEDNLVGNYMPKMVNEIFERQGFFTDINYKTSIESWKYSIDNNVNIKEDELQFIYTAPTVSYPPIQMLPQATGIVLARLIGLDIYSQGMIGRLFNLIFFIFSGYFSIKFLPSKKNFLLILLLSPKILYISSTLSGDVFTNCVAILLISYILKLKFEKKKFNKKNFIVLLLLEPCVAICKVIYLPICFLIFLIPKECFKNLKNKLLVIGIILIIAIIVSLCWMSISNVIPETDSVAGEQLQFVKTHPISYVMVLFRGVQNNYIEWSRDMVGGYMEWGSKLVEPSLISEIVYILFFLSFTQEEKNRINFKLGEIILIILILGIITAAILSAMYVTWTPLHNSVGGLDILGVQGRYFVPIVILLAIILPTKILETKEKIPNVFIYVSILFIQFPSLLNIITHNI